LDGLDAVKVLVGERDRVVTDLSRVAVLEADTDTDADTVTDTLRDRERVTERVSVDCVG
jgi:hypothetical protein